MNNVGNESWMEFFKDYKISLEFSKCDDAARRSNRVYEVLSEVFKSSGKKEEVGHELRKTRCVWI